MKLLTALALLPVAAWASAHAAVSTPLRAASLHVDDEVELVETRALVKARRGRRHRKPINVDSGDVADIAESAWSSSSDEERKRVKEASAWTTTEPDSTDFNEETMVGGWPFSIESTFATLVCILIASAPIVLAAVADEKLTRTHMLESVALIAWLGGVLYLFTSVLKFQSVHWDGYRPLTIVEAIYLLAQILTTVGYGDITPAFPRGQVWVGLNVVIGLMLYGSIVMEVVGIVSARIAKSVEEYKKRSKAEAAAASSEEDPAAGKQQLKNWAGMKEVDFAPMTEAATFFFVMAVIGITFFVNFPGEDRTVMQATYMSVITLSTVGFGAFTPITEFGKVFGALWMLVGVSALAGLITSFVDLMIRLKTIQHVNMEEEGKKFDSTLDDCTKMMGGKQCLDKCDFLKFALMLQKDIPAHEFAKIEKRFASLGPDANGTISLDKVDQAERPPLS